jgi:hypothetical protein
MEETIVKPLMENQNSTSINLPESLIGLKEPEEVKSMHHPYGHLIWGYLLLFTGAIIIIYACIQTYFVYTKVSPIPSFFNFEGVKLDLSKLQPQMDQSGLEEIARKAGLSIPKMNTLPAMEPTEILPAAVLNESSNLGAFIFFMGFAVNVGYKLASLGVKLIRPLYIKV